MNTQTSNQTQTIELDEVIKYHLIYDAFKDAGLEKGARQLSTRVNGNKVLGLGHYIAIVDSYIGDPHPKIPIDLYNESKKVVVNAIRMNKDKFGLKEKLNSEDEEALRQFLDYLKESKELK